MYRPFSPAFRGLKPSLRFTPLLCGLYTCLCVKSEPPQLRALLHQK